MSRSRGGCLNCRQRRRKCDQQRPSCAACNRRHVQCSGYSTEYRWINHAAVPNGSQYDGSAADSQAPCNLQPSVTLTAPPPTYDSRITQPLFRNFLHSGLRLFYKTQSNTWVQPFLVHMSQESQSIPIMGAALQSLISNGDENIPITTMECLDIALKTKRLEIVSRGALLCPGTICAGVFLCAIYANFIQLLQAQPYTPYLRMMADVYQLTNTTITLVPSPEKDPALQHALEYMAVVDLPFLVLGRVCPSLGLWRRFRQAQDDWEGGRRMGVETFTGVHRGLLDIYGDMMHDETSVSVARLWGWSPDEISDSIQHHFWDAWRLAGIVNARRRARFQRGFGSLTNEDETVSILENDVVLSGLMAAIQTVYTHSQLPQNQGLLMINGLLFPLVTVSLEISYLKRHPESKRTLDDVRQSFEQGRTFPLSKVMFQLLDEAWEDGSDCFDMDHAARCKGVELAIM
ncbi:Zn(2)-C6 fungal-type domain-containing protein [Fusarium sp. LHS14.1]|nr:Zn(2)-C6 fungal-type domain-containing protein [Fusarium sp. LHS14.1]